MTVRYKLPCGRVTLVDDEDARFLLVATWHARRADQKRGDRYYVQGLRRGKTIYLHRLIMGDPAGVTIDHRDGDGLDNRRKNLRPATRGQNNANRAAYNVTGYRGVTKVGERFLASISFGRVPGRGKSRHLGRFDTAEEAALAYDAAALERFGEFARLNLPQRVAA